METERRMVKMRGLQQAQVGTHKWRRVTPFETHFCMYTCFRGNRLQQNSMDARRCHRVCEDTHESRYRRTCDPGRDHSTQVPQMQLASQSMAR